MIKAVFFDVDQTLFSHKIKAIPYSSVQAIQFLKKAGVLVFLATGRHLLELMQLPMQDLDFDGYILLNGQMCLDQKFKILFSQEIDERDLDILKKVFYERKIPMIFVEEKDMYLNICPPEIEKIQASISSVPPRLGRPQGNPIYQVTLLSTTENLKKIENQLQYSKCTGWNAFGSDIISKDGGKVKGVEKIMKIFNLRQNEIMAFGDGENDIDMIAFAGIGIAMGNAHPTLKEAADYITKDIDEDGIMMALKFWREKFGDDMGRMG